MGSSCSITSRARAVEIRESIERIAQDSLRRVGQRAELFGPRESDASGEALGARRDVAGQIADALEIGGDHLDGDDLAEVLGQRGPERQRLEDRVVHVDVELIDLEVVGPHLVGESHVSGPQRAQCLGENRLCAAPHPEDDLPQLVESRLEQSGHGSSRARRRPAASESSQGPVLPVTKA